MTNTNLTDLQTSLDYIFQDISLLETALTHRSFLNESNQRKSNERLEYLGDAVLELLVSEHLFRQRPSDPEGTLTSARAAVVRTESLAQLSQKLHLGDFLKMSKGEERSGGRRNISLLANTFEATLGAIYLDGGFIAAQHFLNTHLIPHAENVLQGNLKDPKSLLQEKVQELGYSSPTYTTVSETGPDHSKQFVVAVHVNSHRLASGRGKSKQAAQQAAAEASLDNLPPQMVK